MKSAVKIFILENDQKNILECKSNLSDTYSLFFYSTTEELLRSIPINDTNPKILLSNSSVSSKEAISLLSEKVAHDSSIRWIILGSGQTKKEIQDYFSAGALDYFSRPLHWVELLVKLERAASQKHKNSSMVLSEAQLAKLTLKELRIFNCLERTKGHRLSREEIIHLVWGDQKVSPKSFDVHLFHLRKKLWKMGLQITFIAPSDYRLIRAHE